MEPLDGRVEQGWSHELKGVPEEDAVEGVGRVIEVLLEEILDAARIGLVGQIGAEGFINAADQILRVNLMSEVDQEIDVFLVGAGEIEDREADYVADIEEELFETAALAGE